MHKLLWQDNGRRQIVARRRAMPGNRRDRWPIRWTRAVRREPWRHRRPAGEHNMMAGRMIVRRMGERTADGPEVTPLSQHRQVFANLQAGRPSVNRFKVAANLRRRIWLHIEAVVLR
jgi:hypothetical protein